MELQEKILARLDNLEKLTLLGIKKAYSVEDASRLSGFSKATIYKLISLKKIPYYKSKGGKCVYFERGEFERWLLAERHASEEELQQRALNYCANKPIY